MKSNEEIRIKAAECTALLLSKNTSQFMLKEKVKYYLKFFEEYLLTGEIKEDYYAI